MAAAAQEATLDQLGWLTGCWTTIGAEAGSGEQWTSAAGGTLLGMSRTVRGGKTAAYEFMRITVSPDGKFVFHAQPSGKPAESLVAVKQSASEVVFENLQHDFPQRVIYRNVPPDKLDASIEGLRNGVMRSIPFPMTRASCGAPSKESGK
ncbi:hypothetical protein GHT07_09725 [Caenimonas koreensis DSM 17982]|uniref:DUF6265 domain-containing protein n=2 Tax=Caenimonas TaxID=763439 RepID=A0A844B7Z9_9BURK|nr:hypothetical protein [Caenimonas koreensis DSM 17982]